MENQDSFTGNRDDLDAFLKVATSPIRHPDRTKALEAWRRYKAEAMYARYEKLQAEQEGHGGPYLVAKGWNMLAMRQRLIDLGGINLDGAIIGFVDLRGVRLDGASLRRTWLKSAEMEHASLRNARFEPRELDGEEAYTGYSRLLNSDLSNADLTGADLSCADLSGVNLNGATLRGAKLRHCDLGRASLVGADIRGAAISDSRVHGISAWDITVCDDETLRRDLVVTPAGEPEIRVDDLEIAQFVYLLLNRRKLRNIIQAITRRGVLLLGRFGEGGLDVLRAIAAELRKRGYVPLLFDSEGPENRDKTETALVMAGLAKFVIADVSGRSVMKELEVIAKEIRLPIIPIIEKGRNPPSLFADFGKFDWMHDEVVVFSKPESLCEHLQEAIIRPAEAILARSRREIRYATLD